MLFDFDVLFGQMLSFYTMIAVGFLAYHLKAVGDREVASLSRVLVQVILPLMLLTNIVNTVKAETLPRFPPLLLSLVLTLLLMLAVGWLSGKLFRLGENTICVHTATMGLPNDGLLGYPLWLAVFPDRAGLAIMASCIVYAIAQWGIAYPLTIPRGSGIKFHWKKMLTPPVIATCIGTVLVLLDVHPAGNMVWDTLAGIGGCTKYVSMLYIGAVVAQKGFRQIFGRPVLFAVTFIKMIVLPLLVALVLGILPFTDPAYFYMIVMLSAMPAPMMVCIQAAMNGSDEEYAVGSMVLSTMVCLGTVPFVMYLITLV